MRICEFWPVINRIQLTLAGHRKCRDWGLDRGDNYKQNEPSFQKYNKLNLVFSKFATQSRYILPGVNNCGSFYNRFWQAFRRARFWFIKLKSSNWNRVCFKGQKRIGTFEKCLWKEQVSGNFRQHDQRLPRIFGKHSQTLSNRALRKRSLSSPVMGSR